MLFSHFRCACFCVTWWTVACQAPLSVGFSRQEYWSGLPFPSPGDFPDSRIKPTSLMSPALAGGFFTTSTTWEAYRHIHIYIYIYKTFECIVALSPLHGKQIEAQRVGAFSKVTQLIGCSWESHQTVWLLSLIFSRPNFLVNLHKVEIARTTFVLLCSFHQPT